MKKKFNYVLVLLFLILCQLQSVSAKVTFNQGQATQDIKDLTDPISNWLMAVGFGFTMVSIGYSYINYMGLEEAEKQNTPFHKTVKKHVVAFVIFGMVGVILKWFSIS